MIREAKVEDIFPIIQMWALDKNSMNSEKVDLPVSQKYLDAFQSIILDPNQRLMVFEKNDEVVGSLQLTFIQYLFRHGRKVALIEAVIVKEEYRSKGIGKKLIRWAIEKAKEEKVDVIQLTSNKNRPRALKFYERLGFQRSHEGFKLKMNE